MVNTLTPSVDTPQSIESLLSAFLSGRSSQTIEAYRQDLEDFRSYLGVSTLVKAADKILGGGPGIANATVLHYRNHLKCIGRQHSTINRRLAAIRSLIKLARTFGLIQWTLEIPNLKVEVYRDTRGPGMPKFCELMRLAQNQNDTKAKRDTAILRLLFDLALRASELTSLNMADFDPAANTLAITAKGENQKVTLSVPMASKEALTAWIGVRGSQPGALFLNLDRAQKGGRLTRHGLYALIRRFGMNAGIKTRPHGVRHLSVTEAVKVAQANGYGIEEVLDHSRHRSVATLMIYRDRERDVQGAIAELISSKLQRAKEK